MAVIIAMVIRNMCLSRRQKADLVSSQICFQTLVTLTHLRPQDLRIPFLHQYIQNHFSTVTWLQKSVAVKPYVETSRMGNQQKAEFINRSFWIQNFWGRHGKFSSKSWFRPKGPVCPEFWFSKPNKFSTFVTRNPLTVWSYEMNHWEAERATYGDGIQQSGSFSLLNLRNFVFFFQRLCCPVQFSAVCRCTKFCIF